MQLVHFNPDDERHMRRALELALFAERSEETPVGAVLTDETGQVLGEGWNQPIVTADPTAHAEVIAIRAACRKVANYRLPGSTLYVTLEPCAMCAGAIVNARIAKVVFAARDLRFGAVRSKFRLVDGGLLNHSAHVSEGLLAAECGALLTRFFQSRRPK